MNVLLALAESLYAAAQAGAYEALELQGLAEQLVAAVQEADLYLTGKASNRILERDREWAARYLMGEVWEIYLSDGGYSRLMVQVADPERPAVWLDRGLSLPGVVARWEAALVERSRS